jgi:hypothetical protein
MKLRKSSQIPALASLSSPQFDANPISAASGNVPVLLALPCFAAVSSRWRRRCRYGNLPDIRITFCPIGPGCLEMRF